MLITSSVALIASASLFGLAAAAPIGCEGNGFWWACNRNGGPYQVKKSIYNTAAMPWISHTGYNETTAIGFANWLGQSVNYEAVQPLLTALNATSPQKGTLKSHGEAHVTIITPPEFDQVLYPFLNMSDINKIAQEEGIQSLPFEIKCLGRDSIVDSTTNNRIYVYNIVIWSDKIKHLRYKVWEKYVQNGGEPSNFDWDSAWTGHITIAYDKRDMFVQDNVYKNINSCWAAIDIVD